MKTIQIAIGLLLVGGVPGVQCSFTPSGRGLVLGGALAWALILWGQKRFGHLKAADLFPKGQAAMQRVLVIGVFSTGVLVVTLTWLWASTFAGNESAFVETLLATFLFLISLMMQMHAVRWALALGANAGR